MRLPFAAAVTAATLLAACSQTSQNATPKTDDEKVLYSMGTIVADKFGLQPLGLNDQEIAMLSAGFNDGVHGKPKIEQAERDKLMEKIQEYVTKRMEAAAKKTKEEGEAYLTKAATEAGAVKLTDGIILKITKEGTGKLPVATDTVKVNYEGKLLSGKVFDSTAMHQPPDPATFPLAGVIPCWSQGLLQVKVGSKAQLTCPAAAAYGEQGQPPTIPGNSVLVFDVELLEIVKPEAPPAAAAPAAPPKGK